MNSRINRLKDDLIQQPRYLSVEQAHIITNANKRYSHLSEIMKRAFELYEVMKSITIEIRPDELIVGNRSIGVRSGIVFPRSGLLWIAKEIESLPSRKQDHFLVREEDKKLFFDEILPYWKGYTLEEKINNDFDADLKNIENVVKINQRERAQGHIIPDFTTWLTLGPTGIILLLEKKLSAVDNKDEKKAEFYRAAIITMKGAQIFIKRYADLADKLFVETRDNNYKRISKACINIADDVPTSFHEALQSVWFLLVLLHMESNASSFSLGRFDQYLYPYFLKDINNHRMTNEQALELLECFYIKCNQIVCMRSHFEAEYFAGFPEGFNLVIGGKNRNGENLENKLSLLVLKAQSEIQLPQPNISARLFEGSSEEFISDCLKVISNGGGIPQFFNDEAVIQSLTNTGTSEEDAYEYGVVGCVEISGCGNTLAWSNAAMFNISKVLELTLNHGKCLLSGNKLGIDIGGLDTYQTYEEFCSAFQTQIKHFVILMMKAHEIVDYAHQTILPSPFLSSVIDSCIEKGVDVTAGGAKYNFSGVQLVQVANLVDSLFTIKVLVFEKNIIDKVELYEQIKQNWINDQFKNSLNNAQIKFGNDNDAVDLLCKDWIHYFNSLLANHENARNGKYKLGLYTVSSHVPMGETVGASCDGRYATKPLSDGGVSPQAGADVNGPTSVLKSVSKIPFEIVGNGSLLNLKFSKNILKEEENIHKFILFVKAFINLKIQHMQFNVVSREELIDAQLHPKDHRNLLIRVAGYSARFIELNSKLQDEIINRTEHSI